jgi:hypothetical protein
MLLGVDIHVFTNDKNLTFNTLKMQCMLRWCTKIEEFSPMLHYIEGPCNILAYNLSKVQLPSYSGLDHRGEYVGSCKSQK